MEINRIRQNLFKAARSAEHVMSVFWNGIIAQQQESVSKKIHMASSLERVDISSKPTVRNNEIGHVTLLS